MRPSSGRRRFGRRENRSWQFIASNVVTYSVCIRFLHRRVDNTHLLIPRFEIAGTVSQSSRVFCFLLLPSPTTTFRPSDTPLTYSTSWKHYRSVLRHRIVKIVPPTMFTPNQGYRIDLALSSHHWHSLDELVSDSNFYGGFVSRDVEVRNHLKKLRTGRSWRSGW